MKSGSSLDVDSECLKANISTGILTQLPAMTTSHANFSSCLLGRKIYAVGGNTNKSCESFDLLTGHWTQMARGLPDAYKEDNKSLLGIKKRFIYGFGGGSILKDAPPSNGEERMLRFDEAKL
jgi:hypothetical protein